MGKYELLDIIGGKAPRIIGMASAQDATMVPPGFFSRLQNVRVRRGVPYARFGAVNRSTGIGGGLTISRCVGTWSGTFQGTYTAFVAFRVTEVGVTTIRVYNYNLTSNTYTEVTSGSSRFSSSTTIVGMECVRYNGTDHMVFGNGFQTPRIYNGSTTVVVAKVGAVTAGTQSPGIRTSLDFSTGAIVTESAPSEFSFDVLTGDLDIDSTLNTTTPRSIAIFPPNYRSVSSSLSYPTAEINASSVLGQTLSIFYVPSAGYDLATFLSRVDALVYPASYASVAITAMADNGSGEVRCTSNAHGLSTGDVVQITGSSLFDGQYFVTVIDPNTFDLDDSTWAATGGPFGSFIEMEWVTIYDSSFGNAFKTQMPFNGANQQNTTMSSPSWSPIGGSSVTVNNPAPNAFCANYNTNEFEGRVGFGGIRIWSGGYVKSNDQTVKLYAVFSGGTLDDASRYAITTAYNYWESPTVFPELSKGSSFNVIGGYSAAQFWNYLPSNGMGTTWLINWVNGTTDATADTAIYRSDPTQDAQGANTYGDYYRVATVDVPTNAYVDNGSAGVSSILVAPDQFNEEIPSGSQFVFFNDRLAVGGINSSSGSPELWISEAGNPFRFRRTVRFLNQGIPDESSAVYILFAGETVTTLKRITGSQFGVNDLLIWTNKGMYTVGGIRASRLSQVSPLGKFGTFYPRSVAIYANSVWYVDNEGQVRIVEGGVGTKPVSYQFVDDILRSATLNIRVCGFAASTGYQVFFNASGQSEAQSGLHYDTESEGWVIDTFSAFNVEGVEVIDEGTRRKVYAFDSDSSVWELDVNGQATEDGAGIPIQLYGKEYTNDFATKLYAGKMGIVTDGSSGASEDKTFTTSRYFPFTATSVDGTISVTSANTTTDEAWRYDSGVSGPEVGGSSPSFIPRLSGTVTGGTRIRRFVVNTDVRGYGADRI